MINGLRYTLRQIYESFSFAMESVVVNKMRTFLSLLGITIGIFSIISVYTAIDTMENYMRTQVESFGSNTIYVSKWPWTPEGEDGQYQWWKYLNRPNNTEAEFYELQAMTPEIAKAAIIGGSSMSVIYGNTNYERAGVLGGTEYSLDLYGTKISNGRALTPFEYTTASGNIIIGSTLADELFQGVDPIGKRVKLGGHAATVVGVFEKEGMSEMRDSWDERVWVSLNFFKKMRDLKRTDPTMLVMPTSQFNEDNLADFREILRHNMRRIRRLAPTVEDNFSLNDISLINKIFDSMFITINLAGGVIGLFSILVGGFGVANIMFVSVRERTSQIGIQKALGARPYVILLQFTFEAVLLSVVGGIVGLFLIWILTFVVSGVFGFDITLSLKNIFIGLGISSVVGAISGIFPAYKASRMDPVQAINSNG